ncbi:hypothetical protein B0T11DRAFT_64917 [Plectosphaerella cucumerina]|uniref:Uncharacterized protein n=1 Tax=Plectosphaerella cucumerina TaxID=40658 RepID=A0A8K0TLF0_9PEZI|nr:hypothetical protein B0T11DRAFT_64917 [Plectosphaerella cucumerina]
MAAHAPSIAPSAPAHAGEDTPTPTPTTVAGFAPPPCPPPSTLPPANVSRNRLQETAMAEKAVFWPHVIPCHASRESPGCTGRDFHSSCCKAPTCVKTTADRHLRALQLQSAQQCVSYCMKILSGSRSLRSLFQKHQSHGQCTHNCCWAMGARPFVLPACPCTAQRPARCQLPDLARSAAALPEWEISKTPPSTAPLPPKSGLISSAGDRPAPPTTCRASSRDLELARPSLVAHFESPPATRINVDEQQPYLSWSVQPAVCAQIACSRGIPSSHGLPTGVRYIICARTPASSINSEPGCRKHVWLWNRRRARLDTIPPPKAAGSVSGRRPGLGLARSFAVRLVSMEESAPLRTNLTCMRPAKVLCQYLLVFAHPIFPTWTERAPFPPLRPQQHPRPDIAHYSRKNPAPRTDSRRC